MATKEEKPTLAGVNIKTRKRNIAVALDPGAFADAVAGIFEDSRKDGDEAEEAWLAAGLPALQAADLDFSRYGDTLFEVLFSGGRMASGGHAVEEEGRRRLPRSVLSAHVPKESIPAFVSAFQALIRRRPYLVKALENTLAKLVKSLDFYDAEGREKVAAAVAQCFAAKLGAQPDAVLVGLTNDRAVQKGSSLAWATAFFREYLSAPGESADGLLQLLRRAKLEGRLADLFPPAQRSPQAIEKHFREAGLQPLVDFQARTAADSAAQELRSAVDSALAADPPLEPDDVAAAVGAKVKELAAGGAPPLPAGAAARAVFGGILAAVPTQGRNSQQVMSSVAKAVRAHRALLARFSSGANEAAEAAAAAAAAAAGAKASASAPDDEDEDDEASATDGAAASTSGGAPVDASARGEAALLLHAQAACYEDPKLLKLFASIVRLLYDEGLVAEDAVRWWSRRGAAAKGRHVFQGDLEPFLRWLDEAEEEEDYLTSLPENLGQRLPELREIDLSGHGSATVAPLRALVGASSLEKIEFFFGSNSSVQVEEPLDFLLENFPRLREMKMRKFSSTWNPASRGHLERFAERLKERDPTAVVEFERRP